MLTFTFEIVRLSRGTDIAELRQKQTFLRQMDDKEPTQCRGHHSMLKQPAARLPVKL